MIIFIFSLKPAVIKKIFALLLLATIIIVSCKKKATGPGHTGSFAMTVNGNTQFSAGPIYEIGFTCGSVEQYSLTGTAADSSFLIINLSPITTGPQSFGTGTCSPGLEYSVNHGPTYYSTNSSFTAVSPGSIDITSSGGGQVSGTFSATLYSWATGDSVVITNGVFSKCSY